MSMSIVFSLLFAPLAVQELKVPADPIAAIEGRWTGQWDDAVIEIKKGVATVMKAPTSMPWMVPGTVVARLNSNGHAEGRVYRYTSSTCINFGASKVASEWDYIPCGTVGAHLTTSVATYELHLPLLSLQRSK
jgi:hypothetical protein